MAPNYFTKKGKSSSTILAMGADLKSSFAFQPNAQLYVSQYFGNLENYEVSKRYSSTIHKFTKVFETTPQVILADLHPYYQSSEIGKNLAEKWNSEYVQIQHHKAHLASVLGEHELFDPEEKILGVVWDGTGFGDDANIWGGEFFSYENKEVSRLSHFEYFDWLAGDKMAKEPRLSLLSLTSEKNRLKIKEKFSEREWKVYHKLLEKNTLKTTSTEKLAASSIYTLAKIILKTAKKHHFKTIACSGGVFQ